MRVLVTGANGQLGHDVVQELVRRSYNPIAYSSMEMDITDRSTCCIKLQETKPDAVIHCAAWTSVDAAEEEHNYNNVYAVNVIGTQNVAEACKDIGCKFLYVSTDYVFDGSGETPWSANCQHCIPINVYGRTKLEGEKRVSVLLDKAFIVRTAWLYGLHGNNFISTILNYGRTHDSIKVVEDQIGTPTFTADLARLLVDMIASDKYGIYHAVNEGGYVSRYDLAKIVFRHEEMETKVIPVKTMDYSLTKAARPLNSRMDTSDLINAGFMPLPDWHDALTRYLDLNRGF